LSDEGLSILKSTRLTDHRITEQPLELGLRDAA